MERKPEQQQAIKEHEPNTEFANAWVFVPRQNGPEAVIANQELVNQFFAKVIDTDNTVVYMNVGEVIDPELTSPVALSLQSKYGPRSFALLTRPSESIVGIDTPQEFVEYQEKLRGYSIPTITIDFQDPTVTSASAAAAEKLAGKRIRPYMAHKGLLGDVQAVGGDLVGWNETSIQNQEKLNNKYRFIQWLRSPETHDMLVRHGVATEHTHAAPSAMEVEESDVLSATKSRLDQISSLYQKYEGEIRDYHEAHGVDYQAHEAAVIIRPSWGGGSYETFKIAKTGSRVNEDGELEELYSLGQEGKKYEDMTWHDVEAHLTDQFDNNGSSEKYTITRFIDKVEDPGINAVILVDKDNPENKVIYVAPTHGQVSEGTMCVGTQSNNTVSEKLREKVYFDGSRVQNAEARQRQHALSRVATAVVANDMAIHASDDLIMGVDVMDAAFYEAALAYAVQGTGDEYEAVGPKVYAETNLRLTQRTMHQLTQEAIINKVQGRSGNPLTYEQLLAGYEQTGGSRHFTSYDSHPVTQKGWNRLMQMTADGHEGENILAGFNQAATEGKAEGVYIIMPSVKWDGDNHGTMGIGIMAGTQEEVEMYQQKLYAIANGFEHEETTAIDNL